MNFCNLIKHCHNLITCEVEIEDPLNNEQELFQPQTHVASPAKMLKVKLQAYYADPPTNIFQSIYFPSLESMHYRCPPRYQEFIPGQPPSLIPSRSLLAIMENAPSTIRKLNIDPRSLGPEDPLTCLRLASEITHLSLGVAPGLYYINAEEDMFPADYLDFNIFAIGTGCEDILVPKLEVLQMYDLQELTDETIFRVLISRVDAAQRGDVSPLRHVKMQISRQKQKDIREAVLEQAKSAGFEMKLELHYAPDGPPYKGRSSGKSEIGHSSSVSSVALCCLDCSS